MKFPNDMGILCHGLQALLSTRRHVTLRRNYGTGNILANVYLSRMRSMLGVPKETPPHLPHPGKGDHHGKDITTVRVLVHVP